MPKSLSRTNKLRRQIFFPARFPRLLNMTKDQTNGSHGKKIYFPGGSTASHSAYRRFEVCYMLEMMATSCRV